MSRIRVYELAKEAGMSGKALADKLVELGFDIKGHSSSVDDETADRIRAALRRAVVNEKLEARPSNDAARDSAVRRKTTVIRRRPAAAQADAVDDTPIETSPAEESQIAVESEVSPVVEEQAIPTPERSASPVAEVVETAAAPAEESRLTVAPEIQAVQGQNLML